LIASRQETLAWIVVRLAGTTALSARDHAEGYDMRRCLALAIGVVAVGALAIGALAIGTIAIGSLAMKRATIKKIHIEELTVDKLTVTESNLPRF